jgi:hypothetical protein
MMHLPSAGGDPPTTTLRNRCAGTVESAIKGGDRATVPIEEDICCEKIRGCTYRGPCVLLNIRDAASVATKRKDAMGQGAEVSSIHSITSSARARSPAGTVTPRAFAVLRLTANHNLVGNSMGKSPGRTPLRILSTK